MVEWFLDFWRNFDCEKRPKLRFPINICKDFKPRSFWFCIWVKKVILQNWLDFHGNRPIFGPLAGRKHTKIDPKWGFCKINSMCFNQFTSNLAWVLIVVLARHEYIFKVINPYFGPLVVQKHIKNGPKMRFSHNKVKVFQPIELQPGIWTHMCSCKTWSCF